MPLTIRSAVLARSAVFALSAALLGAEPVLAQVSGSGAAPLPAGRAASLAELRALEKHSLELHAKIAPLVVSVRSASGVLFKGGIVLTAAHVVRRPGQVVPVVLADGRRFRGRSLGVDERTDAGLVKLELPKGTKLPQAELGKSDELKPGQWVWMFGHPGSRQPHGAPLRFGRVLRSYRSWIISDCEMSGGDSGGPLFDHEGRIIGIHSRITQNLDINMHVPIDRFREEWEALLAGEHLKKGDGSPAERAAKRAAAAKMKAAKDDAKSGDAKPGGASGGDTKAGAAEDEMPEASGEEARAERQQPQNRVRRTRITVDRRDVSKAVQTLSAPLRESMVEFVVVGRRKAYGTCIAPGGLVVTKASMLSDLTRARLARGTEAAFEVVGVDEQEDIALVRVEAELKPVEWAEAIPAPGSFLVTAQARSTRPRSIGVLSVSERSGQQRAWMGIRFGDGRGISVSEVLKDSPAERGGLMDGDRLLFVDGKKMNNRLDLLALLARKKAGAPLKIQLQRGGQEQELTMALGTHPDRHGPISRQQRMGLFGPLSQVRRGFTRVLQHDSRLRDTDMGSPVLDLRGGVVGINIARAGRIETLALPAATVRAAVAHIQGEPKRREKL